MEHLGESRIVESLVDGAAWSEEERTHLNACSACQARVTELELLRGELDIARRSQLSAEAENRLFSLFTAVRQPVHQPGWVQRLQEKVTGFVNALPLWDSRQQAAMVGVRSGSKSTYRLLFGAQDTEIELMVEPQDGLLRIVGEVMVDEKQGHNGLALIELMNYANAKSAMEAESDANGRFALDRVPPGTYVMTVTPRYSHMVVIEPLELT